jgi:hypothetical protein
VSATHVVSAALEPLEVSKITSNTAAVLADTTTGSKQAIWVSRFEVNENAGQTPAVTVEIYDVDDAISTYLSAIDADGTTRVVWRAKAITANQGVLFDGGYLIPKGSQLRVTSNDPAGFLDVVGLMSRL